MTERNSNQEFETESQEPDLEEMRAIILERLVQAKHSLFFMPFIALLGLGSLVLATKLWLYDYQKNLSGGFGFILGVILGALFVMSTKPTIVLRYKHFHSTELTREDILEYFRENYEIHQHANHNWWKIGLGVAIGTLPIIRLIYLPLKPFSDMVIFGVGSTGILGLAILNYIHLVKSGVYD